MDLRTASRDFENALQTHIFSRDDSEFGALDNGRFFEAQLAHFLNVAGRVIDERFRDLVSIASQQREMTLAVESATAVVTSVVREHCNPETMLLRMFPALTGEGVDLPPGLTPLDAGDSVDAICSRIASTLDSDIDRLAKHTLIHGVRNDAVSTNAEPAGIKVQPRKRRLKCSLSEGARKRCSTIQKLCHLGVKGMEYCRQMDANKMAPPWREDGCPATYTKACGDERWRKAIQDEKSRHSKHPPIRAHE